MGDVADILGVTASPKSAEPVVDDSKPTAWSTSPEMLDLDDSNIMQSAVSGRNVDLNGSKGGMKVLNPAPSVEDSAPPPAITKTRKSAVKVGSKWIDTQKPARKWVWAPFTSSSRNDGLVLNHWVRAGVEYLDYPYARFDIHLDPVQYTDDEYKSFLINESWTKSETDFLMDLARKLELRWPVIHDRWLEAFDDHVNDDTWQARKVEDLQHRYYTVAAILLQSRISREATLEAKAIETASIALQNNTTDAPTPDPRGAGENRKEEELLLETAAARALASSDPQHQPLIRSLGTGATNKLFDIAYETERRAQLEALWRRSKAEEEEELELRKELKQVESEIRKLKKSGGHIAPTISEPASRTASPSVANPVDRPVTLAPIPTPGFPYLQSGRLVAPTSGVSKLLLKNMDTLLKEMNIPERPLPTKVVCDLYDSVRSDAIALLVLRKTALQKEGLLQAKRLKLAKLGGNVRVVDEETLLGILPPPTTRKSLKTTQKVKATTTTTKAKPTTTKSPSSSASTKAPAVVSSNTGATQSTTVSSGGKTSAGTGGKGTSEKKVRKPSSKRKRTPEPVNPPLPTGGAVAPITKPAAAAAAVAAVLSAAAPTSSAVATKAGGSAGPSGETPSHTISTESKGSGGKKRARKN